MSVKYFFLRLVSYTEKKKKAKKISTLSSTLFSMFFERIMPGGLEEHDEKEVVPCSLFWYIISMFQKCKSGIRNQFPVPY